MRHCFSCPGLSGQVFAVLACVSCYPAVADKAAPCRRLTSNLLEEGFWQPSPSRPGQCGRADGYILEGKELEFYQRRLLKRKGK